MMKKLLGILVAAMLLTACDTKPPPPLAFGASAWPGYEPIYLAHELGYYKSVNLRFVDYGNNAEVEQAFRNNNIDVAALTLDQALLLRRDIPELKIILLLDAAGDRTDVLVTRNAEIGLYHHELQQLLLGWRHALDELKKNQDKSIEIMAKREHMAPKQFEQSFNKLEIYSWQRNQQLMMGEPPPAGKTIVAAQRALMRAGKLRMGIDASMLLEPALLAEPKK